MTKPIPYPLRGEWLITDEGAERILSVWETAQATGKAERIALALEQRNGEPFKNERRCVVTDGIAVMDIDGPLMRKAELFSDISGATSYQWIGATADALRADPSVRKVIIRANSPGGEAAGAGECAEKIARLRDEKYVEGYVETEAASAMLWLLSQCSHITAHATAQVGWIGAIRTLIDTSARDEKDGVKRKQLVSRGAEKKRTDPVDKSVIQRVQRSLDEWGKLFTAAVAAGRGVDEATVLEDFGGGDGMFAEQALAVGLVDAIGDFDSVLARLSGLSPAGATYATRPNRGARTMTMNGVRAADSDNEWKCTGCKEMMGPSASKYCAKCAVPDSDGDDDGDEDDEAEAKAVGLPVKATRVQRLERITALASFEQRALSAANATTHDAAVAIIVRNAESAESVATLQKAHDELRTEARRGQLRTVLESGLASKHLTLGAIQRSIPRVLRGEQKKAWTKAMDKAVAEAEVAAKTATDDEKTKISAKQMIIGAACSVELAAEDLTAIEEYVKGEPATAAETFVEPPRDADAEHAELDSTAQTIKALADKARATYERGNAQSTK